MTVRICKHRSLPAKKISGKPLRDFVTFVPKGAEIVLRTFDYSLLPFPAWTTAFGRGAMLNVAAKKRGLSLFHPFQGEIKPRPMAVVV
jgi:hypothetical protein